jgi:hypothetical protein
MGQREATRKDLAALEALLGVDLPDEFEIKFEISAKGTVSRAHMKVLKDSIVSDFSGLQGMRKVAPCW